MCLNQDEPLHLVTWYNMPSHLVEGDGRQSLFISMEWNFILFQGLGDLRKRGINNPNNNSVKVRAWTSKTLIKSHR